MLGSCVALVMGLLIGCGSRGPEKESSEVAGVAPGRELTTMPAEEVLAKLEPVRRVLKAGVLREGVYTVSYPRTDLFVANDMGRIPVGAGLETEFHFFLCSCGKTQVVGEFCVSEEEGNNVMDELRAGEMTVVSMSNMLLNERPRVMAVRFQGEGSAQGLAGTLKKALKWAGGTELKGAGQGR